MENYEKSIEIPFGAFDSELGGFEYTIPEGFEAVIENGKVKARKADSKDEKIRKAIIGLIEEDYAPAMMHNGIHRSEMLAWLEKQGEQKPIPKDYDAAFDDFMSHIPEKDPESSNSLYTYEDMEAAIKFGIQFGKQQKPEWSEEDEKHVDSLLKRLEGLCKNEFQRTRFAVSEDKDWLKSLRPQKLSNVERIGKNWKPSDEQMYWLKRVIPHTDTEKANEGEVVLNELFEQLKAL